MAFARLQELQELHGPIAFSHGGDTSGACSQALDRCVALRALVLSNPPLALLELAF